MSILAFNKLHYVNGNARVVGHQNTASTVYFYKTVRSHLDKMDTESNVQNNQSNKPAITKYETK